MLRVWALVHSAGISNCKSGLGSVFEEEALAGGKACDPRHSAEHDGNHSAHKFLETF